MNLYFIYILVINDFDSLSLGYYPLRSPVVIFLGVLGYIGVDPVSFPQCTLDFDEQSLCCATFRLFKIGDIYILDKLKKVGCFILVSYGILLLLEVVLVLDVIVIPVQEHVPGKRY